MKFRNVRVEFAEILVGSIRGCEKGRGATQKILSTTLDDRYIYIDLYRYTYIDR